MLWHRRLITYIPKIGGMLWRTLLRGGAVGGVLLGLGLMGCSGLRGAGFGENDLSDFCGQYRKEDRGTGPAGVTTKAKQIEHGLGIPP